MKRKKLLISLCMVTIVALLLGVVSYAWLRREWKPSFSNENIKIQTGSTLSIRLNNNAEKNVVNLNDVFGTAAADFYLKQVSNLSGESEDFFGLEFPKGIDIKSAIVKHLSGEEGESYTDRGARYGYLETSFYLLGNSGDDENQHQYVYIDADSKIAAPQDADPEKAAAYQEMLSAIRVSITVHGDGESIPDKTYGIKLTEERHTGITNQKDYTGAYVAVGHKLEDQISYRTSAEAEVGAWTKTYVEESGSNPVFRPLSDYAMTSETFDASKALFSLSAVESRQITLRVWLEGTDDGCTDDISGLNFDLSIFFAGYDYTTGANAS